MAGLWFVLIIRWTRRKAVNRLESLVSGKSRPRQFGTQPHQSMLSLVSFSVGASRWTCVRGSFCSFALRRPSFPPFSFSRVCSNFAALVGKSSTHQPTTLNLLWSLVPPRHASCQLFCASFSSFPLISLPPPPLSLSPSPLFFCFPSCPLCRADHGPQLTNPFRFPRWQSKGNALGLLLIWLRIHIDSF